MTTYNTGNAIGSTDARDRLDNSENMDILENSTTLTEHADRLGTMRKTRKGMEDEHDTQIAAHETEFADRLLKMAFIPVGTFTSGATLTDARQTLLWELSEGGDGHYYSWAGSFGTSGKVVTAGSSPSPIAAGSWVDRTDDALRDEVRETVFQNMKRLYAEAGFNLVDGSFQMGGSLSGWPDVLWDWATGVAYQWHLDEAKTIPAGSTPETTGGISAGAWVDRTQDTLRSELISGGSSIDEIANTLPDLGSTTGLSMIGTGDGITAQENMSLLNKEIKSPSLPTLGSNYKLVMRPDDLTDAKFLVVTRKSNGKSGYVAMAASDTVAPSDAQNYGGASNIRPTYVINLSHAFVAKSNYYSKSAGTTISSLTAAQINTMWGYIPDGDEQFSQTSALAVSWRSRQVYNLAANADYITYQISKGKSCKVRVGMTNSSSESANILVSTNGTDFYLYNTVVAKHAPSGTITYRDVNVESGFVGNWYVRIVNNTSLAAPLYVVGVNITELAELNSDMDIDNALIVSKAALSGVPNRYQASTGANEFAAKNSANGKFFGTYHGGHSGLLHRLRMDDSSYNLESSNAPSLLLARGAQLHSASNIEIEGTTYSYIAETQFGDGTSITNYSIKLTSGTPILCERAYTHMCTTNRDFDYIHLPILINKLDDGDVNLGSCQFIQQFRSVDAAQLNSYFSSVSEIYNQNGAYVSFTTSYNKQYYGPALGAIGWPLVGGAFVTAKEYF